MTKKYILQLVLTSTLIFANSVAHAIRFGDPDANEHPYVGLAVMLDDAGNPLWRCSGTLIAPRLFLTAGHCTEAPAARAAIWFEENVDAGRPDNGYPFGGGTSVAGTTHTHPSYNPYRFALYDLGLIVLDEAVEMSEYGKLPELGQLDAMATKRGLQDITLTAVGYGLQYTIPVFEIAKRERMQATVQIIDLKGTAGLPVGTAITVSDNVHTGGTCYGDSGGPMFADDTNVIVAVTSWGLNGTCSGVGGGYRVDQADDLAWIYSYFGVYLNY